MRTALLLLTLAASAQAQPTAQSVVDAWRAGWASAEGGVEDVEMAERASHEFQGPRGGRQVEIRATLRYVPGERPRRVVRRVEIEGREVDRQRGSDSGRRFRRAFGPAGRFVTQPPPLPDRLLGAADARDLSETRFEGADAWRVTLDAGRGGSTAWFTRSTSAPRLLALRTEHDGGRVAREIRYTRVRGLDLPASVRASATVRQRRRLRDYVVTLDVVAEYRDHTITSR